MEKKEKNTIVYKISIIVLFVIICLLVIYIVNIKRNNSETENDVSSKTTITDCSKTYSANDFVGYYVFEQKINGGTYQKEELAFRYLYLGEDGTFTYDSGLGETSSKILGNYYIKGNKLILNFLFSEPVKGELYFSNGNYELEILSNTQLKSNLGFTGIPSVTMVKKDEVSNEIKDQYWNIIKNNKVHDYSN